MLSREHQTRTHANNNKTFDCTQFRKTLLKKLLKSESIHNDIVQTIEHGKIFEGGTNPNRRHTLLEEAIGMYPHKIAKH